MMRGTATAMDAFCAAEEKARTKRRFWPKNVKTGCYRLLPRKKSVPQAGAALRGRYDCGG